MDNNLYPVSPQIDDKAFLDVSKNFRNAALKVIITIILFAFFYLLLIGISIALLIVCIWVGVLILSVHFSLITIAAGLGIMGLGIMLFIFCIKFIFSKSIDENADRMEISEKENKELFKFVRQITIETNTKFPKKIFISPDVNAGVFYNSNFWSMFFPIKKNLVIGLGLVNSLNISEFKGVLAHEFGHFSQKSMKLGSYIYTVNRAIFNLVYEKDNWDNVLASWIQSGGIIGFYAKVTFWLAQGIRKLLSGAYGLINTQYSKLSKEMEFHADAVAVSLVGVTSFGNALRKLEFTSTALDFTLNSLKDLTLKNKASQNIFPCHNFIMTYLAKKNKLGWGPSGVIITKEDLLKNLEVSRVNIVDQWATHPELDEREQNIERINITCSENNRSAWDLFENAEFIQKNLSAQMYQVSFPDNQFEMLNDGEFEQFVESEADRYKISEQYNGFYNERFVTLFNTDDIEKPTENLSEFNDIFSPQNVDGIKRFYTNKKDLELLFFIRNKENKIRYFEFDGKKYKRNQVQNLIDTVKKEIKTQESTIEKMDRKAFDFFLAIAINEKRESEFIQYYTQLKSSQELFIELDTLTLKFQNFTLSLQNQMITEEYQVNLLLTECSKLEKDFKNILQNYPKDYLLSILEKGEIRTTLEGYIGNNQYFTKITEFDEVGFENFSNLLLELHNASGVGYGNQLKFFTDFQLRLSSNFS